MNEPLSNTPIPVHPSPLLPVAIVFAAVIIVVGIWVSRNSALPPQPPTNDQTAQQLAAMRQELTTRLDGIDARVTSLQSPSMMAPAPAPSPTPSTAPTNPSPAGTPSQPPSGLNAGTLVQPGTAMVAVAPQSKSLYKDRGERFSIMATPSTCTAMATDATHTPASRWFSSNYISIGFTGYGEWMSYQVATRAQLDSFKAQTDEHYGLTKEWRLSDGSYLLEFGPQDLPDAARNCTVWVTLP